MANVHMSGQQVTHQFNVGNEPDLARLQEDVTRLASALAEMRGKVYPLFPLGDDRSVSTIAPWKVLAHVRKLLHNHEPLIDRYSTKKEA